MIFFLFFTVLLIWVFKADKKYINMMKRIPFPNNENE